LRYYRTTGLILTQMQELVRRVKEALREPWNKPTGKPKSLGLYQAVEVACMYLRQNVTQEFIGDMRDTSQPTISRYVAELVPIVKAVLEEFVPSAGEAIEIVKGRVVLVDGTLTPCWSYEEHQELWNKKHKTTGFNAQLISLLDGTAAWISGPLPGKTHDARAFKETGAADQGACKIGNSVTVLRVAAGHRVGLSRLLGLAVLCVALRSRRGRVRVTARVVAGMRGSSRETGSSAKNHPIPQRNPACSSLPCPRHSLSWSRKCCRP